MPAKKQLRVITPPAQKPLWRKMALTIGIFFIVGIAGIYIGTRFLVQTTLQPAVGMPLSQTPGNTSPALAERSPDPFPLGVDPHKETITENPAVDDFFGQNVHSQYLARDTGTGWLSRILGKLALSNLYQNIASPTGRILVIQSGERKEEIAAHFAKILHWNTEEKEQFLARVIETDSTITDGKFIPGTYVTSRNATPTEVADMVNERFDTLIGSRYTDTIEKVVPLTQTLTIASLLEREAYDFEDSRYISGVIWNRLFADMNLQLDATLQYAKGGKSTSAWWPRVVPADKYIKSPYNTYAHEGLPPSPIANPTFDSVLAALNPKKTDCMYYFHDKNAGFHCSVTYEEHVAQLKEYYGQGK